MLRPFGRARNKIEGGDLRSLPGQSGGVVAEAAADIERP